MWGTLRMVHGKTFHPRCGGDSCVRDIYDIKIKHNRTRPPERSYKPGRRTPDNVVEYGSLTTSL